MTRKDQPALILVIEDEDALRCDIIEELHEAGYRTLAAQDGHQALRLLADVTPDLLLCDITMPGLDGYDVLRAVRAQHLDLATVPFVFLTALSEPYEVVEGKLQGADDYLVKPIDYDLMLATIAARLRQVDHIRSKHDGELATLRNALAGLSGGGAELALDLVAVGIILLDGAGRVVYSNRAADEIATEGNGIQIHADTIQTTDPVSGRALRHAISHALDAAKSGQESVGGIMLHRPGNVDGVSAVVCALPAPGAPALALFLSAADRRGQVSKPLLMDLFGLTPTEARVARALVDGDRPADVAAKLGVSQTTIAFHMRNLFQKTGVNRQADLIALILAGPMMIRSH